MRATTPGTFAADWRAAARLALDGRTPRSAVVVVPEHQCLPFAYYADRDAIADRRDVGERLRGERIACLRDVRDLSLPALDWPDRIAVIALDRSRADVAGLGARLERQGYVRGSTTAFPGGDVLVYESAERRGADAPANPAAQGPP